MALNLANVVLTDTFNTWRVRTNDIIAGAFEVESATPTTVTTTTTFGSNTTLAGTTTTVSSNASFTGANVDIVATVDINNSKIRIVDNDMTITGELTANSFTGDGSALTAVDAATLDSIDSASFLRSDAADAKTSGDLTFNDNIKALFGTAGDLEIFHNGSASLINDAGGGNLKLQLAGSDKLEVTAFGLDATGKLVVSGDVSANAMSASRVTSTGVISATGNISANSFIGDGSQLTNAGSTVATGTADADLLVPFTGITSGTMTSANVDTNFTYNPSTGTLTANSFSGDGSGLTGAGSSLANDAVTTSDLNVVFTGLSSGTMTSANVATGVFTFNPSTGTCSATVFNATSDERAKENIRPIEQPLDKVLQLQGVDFNWKKSGEDSTGLIAQQVEEVLPQVVTKDSEGMKGINYGALVGVLIEAIKELNEKIEK